ncbi:hypothetical protein BDV25DRAFT_167938 [Aspergillus avenaceus]|uniref:Diphthine--ammonia ligase n=1 Tax=Aspergillus avenaceus TaxID=36643 RepID=A0A5N6TSC8_ASPAV|nr:hypothetical protein BDV25DRAFT_167938 [Aspergillus avenaceus]
MSPSPANPQPTTTGLNVIALISGGKDSLYSILHCIRNGHKVVALANLHPPLPSKKDADPVPEGEGEEEEDDMDSFMYQTIGHSVIPLYEPALGLPLYRAPISGGAVDTSRIYRNDAPDQMAEEVEAGREDETESLIPLLRRVMAAHPEANAVSAGAILSTYQRTRIENVAARLGLTPLAWLWMYPVLPAPVERKGLPSDAGLLEDMAAVGCEARIIKVASGGLDEGFLWGDVSGANGALRRRIVKGMMRFAGEDVRGAVLGEGGEYESLAVNGPSFLWKRRIEIGETVDCSGEGGVAFVKFKGAKCVPKDGGCTAGPDDVRRPALLDEAFEEGLEGLPQPSADLKAVDMSIERGSKPVPEVAQARNGGTWTISNITAPEAGPGAGEQMEAIAKKVQGILDATANAPSGPRTTADIVFTTVLIDSMVDFPLMNSIYVSLFKKPNPPARATVACGDSLPDGVKIMVSLVVDLGLRDLRQGLHVQSRSYWAPANIGPYSQAMSIPAQASERMIYIAGQIPLEPSSMDMVSGPESWIESYNLRVVLALQHMWRIGASMQVDWWLGAVAYLTGPENVAIKAQVAWSLWEKIHSQRNDTEEEDEEPTLDAWDIKYGGRAHELPAKSSQTALPNLAVVQSDVLVPPFLAVQVSELPRGSDIEWQGLGYRCESLQMMTGQLDNGRKIDTITSGGLRYTGIEIGIEHSGSKLELSLQSILDRYLKQAGTTHAVLYTAQSVSGDLWPGQIVPCTSVWGQEGRQLAAGVIVQTQTPTDAQEEEGLPPNTIPTESESTIPDTLRQFSRSPHPYYRKSAKHPDPHLLPTECGDRLTPIYWPRTSSDSGTEADDESTGVLKGLPAPPLRLRKGLRSGLNGTADQHDSWLPLLQPWPSLTRSTSRSSRQSSNEESSVGITALRGKATKRKRVEVLQRLLETGLLLSVGAVVLSREDVRSLAWTWRRELLSHALLVTGLYAIYPLRRNGRLRLSGLFSFTIPNTFDPAPLLYPVLIPIYTSLSLARHQPALVLPNILLSLSSLPAPVIPLHEWVHGHSVVHWLVALIPILVSEHMPENNVIPKPLTLRGLNSEILTLVFPFHQALIPTLDFLLTTSILPAELQLLTSALVNLFLFASSPQAEILKALLWLGGLCIFISCRHVVRWEVALARIPSWKFRRSPSGSQSRRNILHIIDHKLCQRLSRTGSSEDAMSDSESGAPVTPISRRTTHEFREKSPGEADRPAPTENGRRQTPTAHRRRHTISSVDEVVPTERIRTTPGGRRKRSMAPGLASFLSLTVPQAQVRKWLYALYVYAAVAVIIMGPIRKYVSERALQGEEPFGWALSYLLGNVSWFRFWVVMWNLEHWIPIPPRADPDIVTGSCSFGWVEHLRQYSFGEANTRLLMVTYCIAVLGTGMGVVFQLSSIAEVDTRRKVFHGMMVLMFLPTIYIDPTFCALALALVLSIFLLLDLFRASQMPPISRPLTHFLAPYVDGRDHRGPVIISHIFLLIGCSIPLWLSLVDIPRSEDRPWGAWNVLSRDVSMVSGVVCVGLGDAAASIVGRRFGRRKWFWGGGKSLEGSVAFAAAVTGGLVFARAWLAAGHWSNHGNNGPDQVSWLSTICKAILAAAGTSATEAILTGCNDNVVVPIVLWLLVRGLSL